MGHKIFVSYKYADADVKTSLGGETLQFVITLLNSKINYPLKMTSIKVKKMTKISVVLVMMLSGKS